MASLLVLEDHLSFTKIHTDAFRTGHGNLGSDRIPQLGAVGIGVAFPSRVAC